MLWSESHNHCRIIDEIVGITVSILGNNDLLLSFLFLLGVSIMNKVIVVLLLEFRSTWVTNGGCNPGVVAKADKDNQ